MSRVWVEWHCFGALNKRQSFDRLNRVILSLFATNCWQSTQKRGKTMKNEWKSVNNYLMTCSPAQRWLRNSIWCSVHSFFRSTQSRSQIKCQHIWWGVRGQHLFTCFDKINQLINQLINSEIRDNTECNDRFVMGCRRIVAAVQIRNPNDRIGLIGTHFRRILIHRKIYNKLLLKCIKC